MGYDIYCASEDHDTLPVGDCLMDLGDRGLEEGLCFHVNVAGMMALREEMEAQGMFAGGKPPSSLLEGWQSVRSDKPGIAWWKLQSNDGWLISADELNEALEGVSQTPVTLHDEHGRRLWAEFLMFLRHCASHGGCVVW